ncbi:hypothetical protein V7S43_019088 [Phytophthora oleae]|uniref:Uncharacterized protein n=1 Tax=Phytophthora oleae TaxID=2107226 RepID=A0ABD3F0Y5_9STRA
MVLPVVPVLYRVQRALVFCSKPGDLVEAREVRDVPGGLQQFGHVAVVQVRNVDAHVRDIARPVDRQETDPLSRCSSSRSPYFTSDTAIILPDSLSVKVSCTHPHRDFVGGVKLPTTKFRAHTAYLRFRRSSPSALARNVITLMAPRFSLQGWHEGWWGREATLEVKLVFTAQYALKMEKTKTMCSLPGYYLALVQMLGPIQQPRTASFQRQ